MDFPFLNGCFHSCVDKYRASAKVVSCREPLEPGFTNGCFTNGCVGSVGICLKTIPMASATELPMELPKELLRRTRDLAETPVALPAAFMHF